MERGLLPPIGGQVGVKRPLVGASDGVSDGESDGESDGASDDNVIGDEVIGTPNVDGRNDGLSLGTVLGDAFGDALGDVLGLSVICVATVVGPNVGDIVGPNVVGASDIMNGIADGETLGWADGEALGWSDGGSPGATGHKSWGGLPKSPWYYTTGSKKGNIRKQKNGYERCGGVSIYRSIEK